MTLRHTVEPEQASVELHHEREWRPYHGNTRDHFYVFLGDRLVWEAWADLDMVAIISGPVFAERLRIKIQQEMDRIAATAEER